MIGSKEIRPKLCIVCSTCNFIQLASVLVHEPDLVCIVESWLDRNVCQRKNLLSNFVSVRLTRSRHGRGILLWIKDSTVGSHLSEQVGTQGVRITEMSG